MRKFLLAAYLTIFLWAIDSNAQMIEDALRLSQSNGIITSRAGALGTAYYGIADDFSAIAFNPAGLALISKGEVSVGFGFMANNVDTEYQYITTSTSSNDAFLSHIGIVAPFKTKFGNASIGIGYYQESNFDNNMQVAAFNPNSTYIDFTARNYGGFAYDLYLTDKYFDTPIKNGLFQESIILESGGLQNVTGGIAFELSKFLTAGFSLTGKWGSYRYLREFIESDKNRLYESFDTTANGRYIDVDFDKVYVDEEIVSTISGITAAFGIQGKVANWMRLGFTIKLPTYYDISEKFAQSAEAFFNNGDRYITYAYDNSYSFTSPWVYALGVSFHFVGFTLTTGAEYSDLSQMEFSNALPETKGLNRVIVTDLVGQLKLGAGFEYEMPFLPVIIRGSVNTVSSAYKEDLDAADVITIAFGTGIYLAPNIRLDALYRWAEFTNMWYLYGNDEDSAKMNFVRNPMDFGVQLTYRY